MRKIISLLLLSFLLIPSVTAIGDIQKTVLITGLVDYWIEDIGNGFSDPRFLYYSGLSNRELIFTVTDGDELSYQVKYNYSDGMDIDFPLITLEDISATTNDITYYEVIKPDNNQFYRKNTVPGFELPIFIGALVICGILIKRRKKT